MFNRTKCLSVEVKNTHKYGGIHGICILVKDTLL